MGASKDEHVRHRTDGHNTMGNLKLTVIKNGNDSPIKDSKVMAKDPTNHIEQSVKNKIDTTWRVCHFSKLPEWLQDNDFILDGYRPPLPNFEVCVKSIFRIHTETGNIWTHMLGCFGFVCIAAYFLNWSTHGVEGQDKIVLSLFFIGAIFCLGFSFVFHTVCCHSQNVCKVFSKFDYFGISLLITFSSVPWFYFSFYCNFYLQLFYIVAICIAGSITTVVSLMDKFAQSEWRVFRTAIFITFGFFSLLPAVHYGFLEGWFDYVAQKNLGWLLLMEVLYTTGACLYAGRVPERFYPGKFDIWLHSHQIFHIFVICAALVHYHNLTELAIHKITVDKCKMDQYLL